MINPMLLLLLVLGANVSAQEIVWTAGPVPPPPQVIDYTVGVAPSTAPSAGEERTTEKNFDQRTIALSFGDGSVSGELVWRALSSSQDGGRPSEMRKSVFKDPRRLEWRQKTYHPASGASAETVWELTVRTKDAPEASYRLVSFSTSGVVIDRAGSEHPFYRGPAGLPLVVALAQAQLHDAGEKPSAAERDEVWTAAFLQVFGLPRVVEAQSIPGRRAFAVLLRGEGLLASDLPIALTIDGPEPPSETFGRRLKSAHPAVRLRYADGAVTVGEGSLATREAVYPAVVARPARDPQLIK